MANKNTLLVLVAATLAVLVPQPASAVPRIQSICTLEGQQPVTLRGTGLVVGLNGTGDPISSAATVRAFAQYLSRSNNPVTPQEIKDTSSVAIVEITVQIPLRGISTGQKLDCQISALNGAKSLEGGFLISSPIGLAAGQDNRVMALASGSLIVEDRVNPTTARLAAGAIMQRTVEMNVLHGANQIRLLVKHPFASFTVAREVERAVNQRFYLEASENIARAASATAVDVTIPQQYENPVEFVALLMDIVVNEASPRGRVIVNVKQGIVVVDGNVEFTPTNIAHRNLNLEVADPFVAVNNGDARQSPQQLATLLAALNQLKVPPDDVIAILREVYESGNLHAEFIER